MDSLNEFPLFCMRIKGMTDVSLYAQGKGQELFLFNDFFVLKDFYMSKPDFPLLILRNLLMRRYLEI